MKKLAHFILIAVGMSVGYFAALRMGVTSLTLVALFGFMMMLIGMSLRRLALLFCYIFLGGWVSSVIESLIFSEGIGQALALGNLSKIIPLPLCFLQGVLLGVMFMIIKDDYAKNKKPGTRSIRFTF